MGIIWGRRQLSKTQWKNTNHRESKKKKLVAENDICTHCYLPLYYVKMEQSVQISACGTQDVLFVSFLTPSPLLPQKNPHVFMNVLQKKSRQASQDTFFLIIKFKSLSISQNQICTIKKHYC